MAIKRQRKRFNSTVTNSALLDQRTLRFCMLNWKAPDQPHIYIHMRLDVTQVLKWIAEKRDQIPRLTMLHFVIKVTAKVFEECPDLNVSIVKAKLKLRDYIHVSTTVNKLNKEGVPITRIIQFTNVDQKSLTELTRESTRSLVNLENASNKAHPKLLKTPFFLWKPLLKWFANRSISLWNPTHQFPSVFITSVGVFRTEMSNVCVDMSAYVPLSGLNATYWVLAMGNVNDHPVVLDGKVEVRPCLDFWNTLDHRFFTGDKLTRISSVLDKYFNNPWLLD